MNAVDRLCPRALKGLVIRETKVILMVHAVDGSLLIVDKMHILIPSLPR